MAMLRRDFLSFTALFSLVHSVNAALSQRKTGVVLDDRFLNHTISEAHPEKPQRYQQIKTQLVQQQWFKKLTVLEPSVDAEPYLELVHSNEHIASIKQQQETHQLATLATSGVLTAVDAVCSGRLDNAFCASRPPGHHALNTGREEGFCYYNHIAIAARYAQQKYQLKKILIIDWDYHHGNGTEAAFYDDASVLFFSTHDKFAYPGTGSELKQGKGDGYGFNINVHLGCGATDEDIFSAFNQQLLPKVASFKPDLILVSAGFDSRQDDLLGCHNISDQGFYQLTMLVKELAATYCNHRVVSILEGGYNIEGNASAALSHLQALTS